MDINLDSARILLSTETLWILNAALALIMFGVALNLQISDFTRLLQHPKAILVGLSSQFLLLPLLTLVLVYLIQPYTSVALGMFMVASCPGGVVSNFYSHLAKGNTALSITLTAIATLSAIVLTPLNVALLGSAYEPTALILKKISISPWDMIQLVGLILGVPIAAGMWVNYRWRLFAQRIRKGFKNASILFFVFLVMAVLYQNLGQFLEYAAYVAGLVVLHNFVALLTGFTWSRIWRLAEADVRSLTIETGIQNSGLALLLILTFFDGLGGMALLAAFWGLWHLISGLLVAGIWSARPIRKEILA